MFKEYDTVKIIALKESMRDFDGTERVKSPPQIGDEGSIVHMLGLIDGILDSYGNGTKIPRELEKVPNNLRNF